MNINPTDKVLHLSFSDDAYGRADVFAGNFNKLSVANKLYKPLNVEAVTLPFKDKEFDVAYCINVLAYVAQPEKILNEIKRISKRAHIKERSVFAEMVFGWEATRWLIDIENFEYVIKSKNPSLVGRFGPIFHGLFANDPNFNEACRANQGLLNIAVDFFSEDQTEEGKIVFRPTQTEYFDDTRIVAGKISDKIDVRHMNKK